MEKKSLRPPTLAVKSTANHANRRRENVWAQEDTHPPRKAFKMSFYQGPINRMCHLSPCSSVLGSDGGSYWTAARALAVSISSPGVRHTNSLPVSTRGLGSCFLPYMATELLWWRGVRACVCVDNNHYLLLLFKIFDQL